MRAFAKTISFRMTAVMATLGGLPDALSSVYLTFKSGLCLVTFVQPTETRLAWSA